MEKPHNFYQVESLQVGQKEKDWKWEDEFRPEQNAKAKHSQLQTLFLPEDHVSWNCTKSINQKVMLKSEETFYSLHGDRFLSGGIRDPFSPKTRATIPSMPFPFSRLLDSAMGHFFSPPRAISLSLYLNVCFSWASQNKLEKCSEIRSANTGPWHYPCPTRTCCLTLCPSHGTHLSPPPWKLDSLGRPISVPLSRGSTIPLVTWASAWHWQESGAGKDFVSKLQKLGSLSKFLCCEHAEEWNTAQLTWRKQWCTAVLLPGTGKTFLGNIFCLLMSPQQKALDLSQLPESSHSFRFLLSFSISFSLCF